MNIFFIFMFMFFIFLFNGEVDSINVPCFNLYPSLFSSKIQSSDKHKIVLFFLKREPFSAFTTPETGKVGTLFEIGINSKEVLHEQIREHNKTENIYKNIFLFSSNIIHYSFML